LLVLLGFFPVIPIIMLLLLQFFLVSKVLGMCEMNAGATCEGDEYYMNWMNDYTRENQQQSHARSEVFGVLNGGPLWCKAMCEYFALTGCCQYEVKSQQCKFKKAGKVISSDKFEWKYEKGTFNRIGKNMLQWGGMCSYTSNQDEFMITYDRGTSCDWDGRDKRGRATLGGGNHSPEACKKACMDRPECVFASLSRKSSSTSKGYCHTFTTCNYYRTSGEKRFDMWQKVDKSAPYKWFDDRLISNLNKGAHCAMDGHCKSGNCDMPSNPDGWALCMTASETSVETSVGGGRYAAPGNVAKEESRTSVAATLAMARAPTTQDQPSTVVQVFAVVGLGFMLYGAGRFYFNK